MSIWIVTHGEKEPGRNPRMTEKGWKQVQSLRIHLPPDKGNIPLILRGEASRHRDVRDALGLEDHPNQGVSNLWGGAGSLERRGGVPFMILADGEHVPFTSNAALMHPSVKAAIAQLPAGTLICAGKELIAGVLAKSGQGKSAALYRVDVVGSELVATVVAEAGE